MCGSPVHVCLKAIVWPGWTGNFRREVLGDEYRYFVAGVVDEHGSLAVAELSTARGNEERHGGDDPNDESWATICGWGTMVP